MNGWMIGFIVVAVLLVASLVFGILSFTGKNDESDKKDKAQKELAATKERLGTSQGAGQILGDLVRTGAKSADDLKTCTDTARQFAIDVLQSGGNIGQPIVDEANTVDSRCGTSDQSYQDFVNALNKLQNK